MALLEIEDLTFAYPGAARPALDRVSLHVEAGSFLCLCGLSGSGKTTLLRHLKGALAPHGQRSGRVLLEGRPLEEVSAAEQARRIGFVMQDPTDQIVADRVDHELAFGLENLGCDPRTMAQRVAETAAWLGLEPWLHWPTNALSGGQKQRMNLAAALALQPALLVLDEPTSALDPLAAADFLATVRKANRELGMTVLLAEHRLEEAYAEADQVVALEAGRVVAIGTPREAARSLRRAGSGLVRSLPAPLRIYQGVEQGGASCASAADDPAVTASPLLPPLTVGEGRRWLCSYAQSHAVARRAFPDELLAPSPEAIVLRAQDLWLRYERDGTDVLRGASLAVPRGAMLALMGGNGAGKSTLLRALCGLERPYRGRVEALGRPLRAWKGQSLFHGGVALLPQDPRELFVEDTVAAELEEMLAGPRDGEGASATPFPPTERLAEAAALCGLDGLLDRHPFDLSRGEQQRVALAKVLLLDPQVLLLDEPTRGLDALRKDELAALLGRLVARGATVVMASHDTEFCAQHATQVALLFDGAIAAIGAPRRFFTESLFYAPAASRMSRGTLPNAITPQEVVALCQGSTAE